MIKMLVGFVCIALMCSCGDGATEREQLKAVNESLVYSNKLMMRQNEMSYSAFEEQKRDAAKYQRTMKMSPAMERIKKLSAELISQIDAPGMGKDDDVDARLKLLASNYRKDVLDIFDNRDSNEIVRLFVLPAGTAWVSITSSDTLLRALMRNKLQNDVLLTEKKLLEYCLHSTGSLDDYILFDKYSVWAGANSSYVMPGEKMEITAGVGQFAAYIRPRFNFDQRDVEAKPYGVAVYSFKAPQKPGKYSVPLVVKYIDPNTGKEVVITKNIEYTVADVKQ